MMRLVCVFFLILIVVGDGKELFSACESKEMNICVKNYFSSSSLSKTCASSKIRRELNECFADAVTDCSEDEENQCEEGNCPDDDKTSKGHTPHRKLNTALCMIMDKKFVMNCFGSAVSEADCYSKKNGYSTINIKILHELSSNCIKSEKKCGKGADDILKMALQDVTEEFGK